MREDEEAIVYFRGRLESDYNAEDLVDVDDEGSPELDDLDQEDLVELATELGCSGFTDETEEDDLRSLIERRLKVELEPVIEVKHYINRNKGKPGMEAWNQCGDPAAAVGAESYKFETECRFCHERMNGGRDSGVSAQTLYAWSIYDTRCDHKVPEGGSDRRGSRRNRGDEDKKKNKYEPCTMRTKKRCKWCSSNAKIDPRPQKDIPLEELKELVSQGYARAYTGGGKYIELPETDCSKIDDLEHQAKAMCRGCGDGDLTVSGAECPSCGHDFDFDDLVSEGWDPDEYDPIDITCGACGKAVQPKPEYECSEECDDPAPARLGDVPVRVKMTMEGQNNRRVFHFSLAGRPEVYEYGEDDEWDEMRRIPLPYFEAMFAPPDVAQQIKQLGLAEDPLTGEAVDASVPDAPTVGRAGKILNKGGKTKGGKTKGGKPKTKVGKVNRRGGFLRRG